VHLSLSALLVQILDRFPQHPLLHVLKWVPICKVGADMPLPRLSTRFMFSVATICSGSHAHTLDVHRHTAVSCDAIPANLPSTLWDTCSASFDSATYSSVWSCLTPTIWQPKWLNQQKGCGEKANEGDDAFRWITTILRVFQDPNGKAKDVGSAFRANSKMLHCRTMQKIFDYPEPSDFMTGTTPTLLSCATLTCASICAHLYTPPPSLLPESDHDCHKVCNNKYGAAHIRAAPPLQLEGWPADPSKDMNYLLFMGRRKLLQQMAAKYVFKSDHFPSNK
jgi:hypothetical protein